VAEKNETATQIAAKVSSLGQLCSTVQACQRKRYDWSTLQKHDDLPLEHTLMYSSQQQLAEIRRTRVHQHTIV
jgi:hypothetical protein